MDKDRIEGTIKEGEGKAEEAWGRMTNDPDAEAKGDAKQVEGNVQQGWGEAKDTVRDVTDDH
jgi:uncharacterized protein YjbJ (UPF0337 family)